MGHIHRRDFLKLGLAAAAVAALPPRIRAAIRLGKAKKLSDASRLVQVPVQKHLIVESPPADDIIEALRRELKEAAAEKRPVAVSAARHSMGGQSLPRDGIAITLANPQVEIDSAAKVARVSAGTRWRQVIISASAAPFASTLTVGRCPTVRSAAPCARSG